MNRIIAILVLLLTVLPSFCQKRNNKGQKVVSRVEVYVPYRNNLHYLTINFDYDKQNNLIGIEHKSDLRRIVWKKQNGIITRVQYNEDSSLNKKYSYKIETNKQGLITKCTEIWHGNNGDESEKVYCYAYENNFCVARCDRFFFHDKGRPIKENNVRHETRYAMDSNGDVFYSGYYTYFWQKEQRVEPRIDWKLIEYYTDIISDMNIDASLLYEYILSTDDFEMITEWHGEHSSHLQKSHAAGWYFIYHFDNRANDNQGNLTQMDVYSDLLVDEHNVKQLYRTFKLYYLE